ncbi:WecB/TagA/CpsF family glycosyltransferase [Terriglobus albidus]|uniref:WecB/TagA/CpsF family glycosyltransferase n=1 Tax=Terriglobus albidus TaxID=1592106 RepID=UPI0021DFBF4A|nr:WecB/TagA/CpsF family glycosyltransferase [Terriglobus albidus]
MSSRKSAPEKVDVLDVPIAVLSMQDAIDFANTWDVRPGNAHMAAFTTVHMVVEARKDEHLRAILAETDMNCPDGAPVAWIGNRQAKGGLSRTSGPDFMPAFCAQGVQLGYRHFIYGGGPGIAEQAAQNLQTHFPGLQISGYYSPPFRPLTEEEDREVCEMINDSSTDFVWVCLGCPKQEKWMFDHKSKLNVRGIFAVGLAVDVMAGARTRAPRALGLMGFEWLFRLMQEPGRLWKRYTFTNALFLAWVLRDMLRNPFADLGSN